MRRYWFLIVQPFVGVGLYFLVGIALFPSVEHLREVESGQPRTHWYDWAFLFMILADVVLFWIWKRDRKPV
jgi:hypothetical protein